MRSQLVRNLQIGFGISLLFLVCITVASFISIQNLLSSRRWVDHSKLVISKLEYALSVMKDAETGQRGYLYTDDKEFLEPYTGSYQKALLAINEFRQLTTDNATQQANARVLKDIVEKRLDILQRLIDRHRAGQKVTAKDLLQGKNAMDQLRAAVKKTELDEDHLLQDRLARLERFTTLTPVFLVLATLAAIIISVVAYYRVMNGISERDRLHAEIEVRERQTAQLNEELASVNEELEAANEELAAANEELNSNNDELAAFNEELASANEELNAANEQLVEAQDSVNDLNEKLGASNEELSATVEELSTSRESLQQLNDELEERVEVRTRELTESEGRFRVVIETMPQIAWTNVPGGEVTFFNTHWYKYTALSEEQSLGWKWTSSVHPDELAFASEQYTSILQSGKGGGFEIRKKRYDGRYRWHQVRMQPVKNETGKIQLWVGTAADIDDLKNLQQQKDDFISIASHELKTPVTSLKMSLQLLDRNKDNASYPVTGRLIGQANKSLDRVSVLIDELLNVSKLNQGQLHLNKTRFKASQVIIDSGQHVALDGTHKIVTDGDTEIEIFADPERIEQVLVNFINNAVKYAPHSREILISVYKENKAVRFAVSDKGPGIAAEKVPHLFQRYYRVDSQGIQFSGLGLGLYISSEIVKKHGGQIGVETEPGKGSTFWFTIPESVENN
ncbi:MAG TPA: ATP-binding protein [Mucilaginibacter sp.]|jgi:PAS domain S-box-containing protein|nr:ATP-binding protein [Mucilaginibacter sp.]